MTQVDLDPPSKKQLLKTTGIAALIAVVMLFVAVLPAEYNIDPLRTGHLLGLTDEPETPLHSHQLISGDVQSHSITVTLAPSEELIADGKNPWLEAGLKVYLDEGELFQYSWSSSAPIVYDLHNDKQGSYHHGAGVSDGADGYLVAPIDGCHGWAIKNDGSAPVSFTLTITGPFDPDTEVYLGQDQTPDLC